MESGSRIVLDLDDEQLDILLLAVNHLIAEYTNFNFCKEYIDSCKKLWSVLYKLKISVYYER